MQASNSIPANPDGFFYMGQCVHLHFQDIYFANCIGFTVYSKLNAYQNHTNQNVLSSECQTCGVREDTEHFSLHCQKYTKQREKLQQEIYFITGNLFMDLDTLLQVESARQEVILSAVLNNIEETRRFKDRKFLIFLF